MRAAICRATLPSQNNASSTPEAKREHPIVDAKVVNLIPKTAYNTTKHAFI